MKIKEKTFKRRTCCGDFTLYQLDGWDKDDWICADDFLRELMENNYFIETKDYKKGFEILSEYFDSIADEEKSSVHKKLKELGL